MDDAPEVVIIGESQSGEPIRPGKYIHTEQKERQFLSDLDLAQLPLFTFSEEAANHVQLPLATETAPPPPELFEDLWGNALVPPIPLTGKDEPLSDCQENSSVPPDTDDTEWWATPTNEEQTPGLLDLVYTPDWQDFDGELHMVETATTIEDSNFDEFLLLDVDNALLEMQEEEAQEVSSNQKEKRQPVLLSGRGNVEGWNGSIGLFYINWELGEIAEAEALKRLGYAERKISEATRNYILQAARMARLPRLEEKRLTERLAALRAHLSSLPPVEEEQDDPYRDERNTLAADILSLEQTLIVRMQWVAIKKAPRFLGYGIELEDLIQHGMIGVVNGVRKFDITRGARLILSVNTWVFQVLNRAISDYGHQIRMPVYVVQQRRRIKEQHQKLRASLERPPTRRELAEAAQLSLTELEEIMAAYKQCISLESYKRAEYLHDGYSFQSIEDALIDEQTFSESLIRFYDRAAISDMISILTEREQRILCLRFGLCDDGESADEQTLEEIGQQFHITRERVRQLEKKALEKIQKKLQL